MEFTSYSDLCSFQPFSGCLLCARHCAAAGSCVTNKNKAIAVFREFTVFGGREINKELLSK